MVKNTVPTNPALLNEQLIPIQKCGEKFPYRVGRKATERFFRHGVRGVRLDTVLIGNRRFTSVEAIERFLQATNKPTEGQEGPRRMTGQELKVAKNQTGLQ